MKKMLSAVAALVVLAMALTGAQESPTVPVIPEEPNLAAIVVTQEKIDEKRGIAITIEYTASADEARFTYVCPTAVFDQGTALVAINKSIEDFLKKTVDPQTGKRKYYLFTRNRDDNTKYDYVKKTASYTSYVLFATNTIR